MSQIKTLKQHVSIVYNIGLHVFINLLVSALSRDIKHTLLGYIQRFFQQEHSFIYKI